MGSIRLLGLITLVSCCIDAAHARRASAFDGPAGRDAAAGFGAPGTVVLVGSMLGASNQRLSTYASRGLAAEASVHVFLGSRLSIGVAGRESWSDSLSSGVEQSTIQYGLEARLGGLLPFSPWTSFWPQLGLGFIHQAVDYNDGSGASVSILDGPSSYITATLDLPVVLHATRWFFVGLGPKLQLAYADGNEFLSVAGHFMFGGALGLGGG